MATLKRTAEGYEYYDFSDAQFTDSEEERSRLARLIAEAVAAQKAQTQGSSNIQDVLPVTQPQPEPLELNTSWLDTIQPEQPVPELPTYNATTTPNMLEPGPNIPRARTNPRWFEEGSSLGGVEDYIENALEPTARVQAGAVSLLPQIFYGFGGGLAEISDVAKDAARNTQSMHSRALLNLVGGPSAIAEMAGYPDWAQQIAGQGEVAKKVIHDIFGVSHTPRDSINRAADFVGQNVVPAKQYSAALSGGLSAFRHIAQQFVTPPEPTTRPSNLLDTTREQMQREADIAKRHLDAGFEPPVEYDPNTGRARRKYTPREDLAGTISVPVDTIGGTTRVKKSDFTALGYVTMATIGLIAAPFIHAKVKGALPSLRSAFQWPARSIYREAPGHVIGLRKQVTQSVSTPMDYARTVGDDATAGITRIAQRVGVSPRIVHEMQDTFHVMTHASGHAIADNAVMNGRAYTPSIQFQTKTPIAKIAQQDSPEFTRYVQLWDTTDIINKKLTAIQLGTAKPTPGPPTGRGMEMHVVTQNISAMERTPIGPQLKQLHADYKQNLVDLWKFQRGQYGTLSKADHAKKLQQDRNFMPGSRQPNLGRREETFINEGAATTNMADHIHHEIRMRLNNEARGRFIDAVRVETGDRIFNPISAEQFRTLKTGKISMMRRGHAEYYSTDALIADVLKLDPAFYTNQAAIILNRSKRLFEATTTGMLAPNFAPVSMVRNHFISLVTAPTQYTNSFGIATQLERQNPLSTLAAVPRQLAPQVARSTGNAIERMRGGPTEAAFDKLSQDITNMLNQGSGGWLGRNLTPATLQGLGRRLTHAYDTSIYAQLQSVGTHRGSLLQQQQISNANLVRAAQDTNLPWARDFLNGYQALIHSIHEAPGFAFAHKNFAKVPIDKLVLDVRRLTGDNRIAGQFRVGTEGHMIRFDPDPSRVSHTLMTPVAKAYGGTAEVLRNAGPWANQTMQGMKRIAEEYIKDPVGFMTKYWLYAMLPAMALEAYTRALGNDPDGVSYSEAKYLRTDYAQTMNYWIPLPGRSFKDAISLPRVHEMGPGQRMAEITMDHISRTNNFPIEEDMKRMALSALETVFIPAMPPLINIALGSIGQTGMMGIYGGSSWTRRSTPFDTSQPSGFQHNIELMFRAQLGGLATTLGEGYAAYTNTDKEWKTNAPMNALSAASKSVVRRTPIVRDIVGELPPISGSSPTIEWMYEHNRQINELLNFYRTDQAGMGINVQPPSRAGGKITSEVLGNVGAPSELPSQSAGLDQEKPTNPLYSLFIAQLNDRFRHDAPSTGGIGMRSTMKHYRTITENLNRLRGVNDGSNSRWQEQLVDKDEQMELMKRYRVDTTDLRAVRNFYLKQRHDTAGFVRNTIMAVEEDFTRQAMDILNDPVKLATASPELIAALQAMKGGRIRFKDLDPYKQENPRAIERRGSEQNPPMVPYEPEITLPGEYVPY